MRFISSLLLLSIVIGTSNGQTRDIQRARTLAVSFLNTHSKLKPMEGDEGSFDMCDQPYYVFNDSVNNRFVIVGGDERMEDILGYGDGTIDDTCMPDGLRYILTEYASQYNHIQQLPVKSSCKIKKKFGDPVNTKIEPLISSKWGQEIPYNNYTPRIGYSRSSSGCVATAMAQIMNYYKYPECGVGYYSYTSRTRNFYLEVDFSQTYFDWDNMVDNYKRNYTMEQGSAVATLMRSCGISVAMDYASDDQMSSGAYSYDVPFALINNFAYNPHIQYYNKSFYSKEDWEQIIYDELKSNRPIYYSGSNSDGGHAFILDGADGDGRFHFNFGWSGTGDGYFVLDTGDIDCHDYQSNQAMVCHIYPEPTGADENVFYADCFTPSSFAEDINGQIRFSLNKCDCYSNQTSLSRGIVRRWNIGLGLYDDKFDLLKTFSITTKDLGCTESMGNVTLTFPIGDYPLDEDIVYYLAPIVSSDELPDVFSRIKTIGGEDDYYSVRLTGDTVTLSDRFNRSFSDSGINYYVTDFIENHVSVNTGSYRGYISIPDTVEHNGATYTVTDIADRAFLNSDWLFSISLPKSIICIGAWAFDGCRRLEYVKCAAPVPPVCKYNVTYPFTDVAYTATLYVPMGTYQQYCSAAGWSEFYNIIERDMDETGIKDINNDNGAKKVFSIDGLFLKELHHNEILSLPKGIYIIDGQKTILR